MGDPLVEVDLWWRGLDEEFERLERRLTNAARGLTVEVWNSVLARSPQWSGAFAASWTYCVNTPSFHDRSGLIPQESLGAGDSPGDAEGWVPVNSRQAGSPEAIAIANERSSGASWAFHLGDKVFLTNGVSHGRDGYAADLEEGKFVLRAVNSPGRPVYYTLRSVRAKYAGKIGPRQTAALEKAPAL